MKQTNNICFTIGVAAIMIVVTPVRIAAEPSKKDTSKTPRSTAKADDEKQRKIEQQQAQVLRQQREQARQAQIEELKNAAFQQFQANKDAIIKKAFGDAITPDDKTGKKFVEDAKILGYESGPKDLEGAIDNWQNMDGGFGKAKQTGSDYLERARAPLTNTALSIDERTRLATAEIENGVKEIEKLGNDFGLELRGIEARFTRPSAKLLADEFRSLSSEFKMEPAPKPYMPPDDPAPAAGSDHLGASPSPNPQASGQNLVIPDTFVTAAEKSAEVSKKVKEEAERLLAQLKPTIDALSQDPQTADSGSGGGGGESGGGGEEDKKEQPKNAGRGGGGGGGGGGSGGGGNSEKSPVSDFAGVPPTTLFSPENSNQDRDLPSMSGSSDRRPLGLELGGAMALRNNFRGAPPAQAPNPPAIATKHPGGNNEIQLTGISVPGLVNPTSRGFSSGDPRETAGTGRFGLGPSGRETPLNAGIFEGIGGSGGSDRARNPDENLGNFLSDQLVPNDNNDDVVGLAKMGDGGKLPAALALLRNPGKLPTKNGKKTIMDHVGEVGKLCLTEFRGKVNVCDH